MARTAVTTKKKVPLGKIATEAHSRGDLAEAERCYRMLLKEHPDNADLLASLGQVCLDQQKFDDSIGFLTRAVELDPESSKALYNLGLSYQKQYKNDQAIPYYEKALAADPTLTAAHNNLAAIYHERARYTDTARLLEQALAVKPDSANVIGNIGLVLSETGRVKEAIAHLKRAVELNPELNVAHSNLLFNLHYLSENSPETIYEAHTAWARQYAPRFAAERLPHNNSRDATRRLRIGYLSPDFRLHSVAYFMVPIIKSHNRSEFEIFCYSDVKRPDDLTEHFHKLTDNWREIAHMSDADVARQIREDEIDILVDLAGHTSENRLLVFARKPAPIQITYLGYPNTTGLDEIDYRLSDAWADPPGVLDHLYAEKLVRLPATFLCYQPPTNTPDVLPEIPASKNGHITFCSFNTLQKITDDVISVWSEILKRVPDSHMVFKAKGLADPNAVERLSGEFLKHGIEQSRLTFRSSLPNVLHHLDLYNSIDIALDTFPYNGTTTTVEALWMGVPVICVKGNAHVSLVGTSLLNNVGLTELLAESKEDYIERAIQLALDRRRIQQYRTTLRERLRRSPLMEAATFTANLEQCFRQMWRNYCGESLTDVATSPRAEIRPSVDNNATMQASASGQIELSLADGTQLYAEANIDNRETFALLEFYDWYPIDGGLLRRVIQPGMRVLDIGGNGTFSIIAARSAGAEGQVWCSTTAPGAECLEKSAIKNGLTNIKILSDSGEGLDRLLVSTGIGGIDLIHVESLASLNTIVGSHFIAMEHPLIVISPPDTIAKNDTTLTHLIDLGYTAFYPVAALGVLAPFPLSSSPECASVSLYFCHRAHIKHLSEQRLLITAADDPGNHEPRDDRLWLRYFNALPYTQPFAAQWSVTNDQSGIEYQNALRHYVLAQHSEIPLQKRYGALSKAFDVMVGLLNSDPTLPRLLTTARIAADLGLRNAASDTLSVIIGLFSSDQPLELSEIFLPAHPRYDALIPNDPVGAWCLAAVLEQYEAMRTATAYDSNNEDLERLNFFSTLGFASPEMERKRQLVDIRLKKQRVGQHPAHQPMPVVAPANKAQSTTKPKIAILHHLARTGGTLISKCLGCIDGNILLSEIHPLLSVKGPAEQAKDWFGLLTDEDIAAFNTGDAHGYPELIELINAKCQARGEHLIIRDWSHIDFTAVPFVSHPSYQLQQSQILEHHFHLHQIATVRHPLDSYLSVSRLAIMNGRLVLDDYLKGCHEFALKAKEIGFVRYEDFCVDPSNVLKQICATLGVTYSDAFLENYANYTTITGEVSGGRPVERIQIPKRRPISTELLNALENNQDYWATLEILGYEHDVTA